MISKLNHKNEETARTIHSLFQLCYKLEALLLKLDIADFPPLNRTITDIQKSTSDFYGIQEQTQLIALIEVESSKEGNHIASLVTHPDHFRKGLASQLVHFVLETKMTENITVETALNNVSATKLYQKFGFQKVKQWDTKTGLRLVRFKK